MHRKRMVGIVVAAVVASMGIATAGASAAGSLTGAGSTLITPLMQEWGAHSGISITYGSVGSGTGIADITARSVNFGASDAPLTSAQAAACNGCAQVPWALTATAIGYKLAGVRGLKLTGPLLAQIYQGHITNWDSPAIKRVNKGKHLPNLKITPVFRSDGSGDTYAFTDFLSKVSGSWRTHVGRSTSVSFPTGVGAKGNAGVTFVVGSTNGSVGYIAASYLISHAIPAAALKNAAGKFEYPNLSNIAAAAKSVRRVPRNNELHIVYPKAKYSAAYPLSTFTYGIFPKSSSDSSTLKQLIRYAVGPGQAYGPALDFSKLPKEVKSADLRTANTLH